MLSEMLAKVYALTPNAALPLLMWDVTDYDSRQPKSGCLGLELESVIALRVSLVLHARSWGLSHDRRITTSKTLL